MMQQIIQIGNSVGITFPAEYAKKVGLKPGKQVEVVHDAEKEITIINVGKKKLTSTVTPEFQQWLQDVATREEDTIKKLAKV